jgi:hypothetical protein
MGEFNARIFLENLMEDETGFGSIHLQCAVLYLAAAIPGMMPLAAVLDLFSYILG